MRSPSSGRKAPDSHRATRTIERAREPGAFLCDPFPKQRNGAQCTECLVCLHRCPNEAVQYGKISLNRRRYIHPVLAHS